MGNALVKSTGLRAVRLAHELKQTDVAKAAGVHELMISRWERTPPPLWGRLSRIADALNVSADEILGRVPTTPVVDALAREDRELLDAMHADCVVLFGESMVDRMGGWRRIARMQWLGHLIGRRDALLRMPSDNLPMTPTPPNVLQPAPQEWYTGWESPRQEARRLNRSEPKRIRALQKGQRVLSKGASE